MALENLYEACTVVVIMWKLECNYMEKVKCKEPYTMSTRHIITFLILESPFALFSKGKIHCSVKDITINDGIKKLNNFTSG
jgi:hypothetical protein